MAYVAGRFRKCGKCGSCALIEMAPAQFDERSEVWVGQQICQDCGQSMYYSSRAETSDEEVAMAKKGKKKFNAKTTKTTKAATRKRAAQEAAAKEPVHRINTHKSNGGMGESAQVAPAGEEKVSIVEAINRARKERGDVVVDDDLAPGQMRELGEYYERLADAQAAYLAKSEAAKVAKKAVDSAQAMINERVAAYTHRPSMPLFDAPQAEQDLEDMVDAAEEAGHEGMHAE